jgi:hypothetical protein
LLDPKLIATQFCSILLNKFHHRTIILRALSV